MIHAAQKRAAVVAAAAALDRSCPRGGDCLTGCLWTCLCRPEVDCLTCCEIEFWSMGSTACRRHNASTESVSSTFRVHMMHTTKTLRNAVKATATAAQRYRPRPKISQRRIDVTLSKDLAQRATAAHPVCVLTAFMMTNNGGMAFPLHQRCI